MRKISSFSFVVGVSCLLMAGCDTMTRNVFSDAPYSNNDHRARTVYDNQHTATPHNHRDYRYRHQNDQTMTNEHKTQEASGADTSTSTMPKVESSSRVIKKTNQGSGPQVPDMAPVVGQ